MSDLAKLIIHPSILKPMNPSASEETLARAVESVLETTDAKERIEKRKQISEQRRERSDTLWFELILSMSTWQGSGGSDLATEKKYYTQVTYDRLLQMDEDDRIQHLEEVLLNAGVNMHQKKSRYINSHVERIEAMGGLEMAQEEFESKDGKNAKMDFLKQFKGIGDKYARNIGMDLYHPDFRDTIALDTRIGNVTDKLDIKFDTYEQEEIFYASVADRLSITPWELDRILYRYTDEVIDEIS
jgi:thermostable 8-oxoguanine DNA glycosylase